MICVAGSIHPGYECIKDSHGVVVLAREGSKPANDEVKEDDERKEVKRVVRSTYRDNDCIMEELQRRSVRL